MPMFTAKVIQGKTIQKFLTLNSNPADILGLVKNGLEKQYPKEQDMC